MEAADGRSRGSSQCGGKEINESSIIQVEHWYPQGPSAVWKALTDPVLHARWWAAGDVRPIVGHCFDLDMGKWGKRPCKVVQVEPERLFKYLFATGTLDTIITWQLMEEGTGTRLKLSQEGFDLDSPMGRDAFEGMKQGWPRVLSRLGEELQR